MRYNIGDRQNRANFAKGGHRAVATKCVKERIVFSLHRASGLSHRRFCSTVANFLLGHVDDGIAIFRSRGAGRGVLSKIMEIPTDSLTLRARAIASVADSPPRFPRNIDRDRFRSPAPAVIGASGPKLSSSHERQPWYLCFSNRPTWSVNRQQFCPSHSPWPCPSFTLRNIYTYNERYILISLFSNRRAHYVC